MNNIFGDDSAEIEWYTGLLVDLSLRSESHFSLFRHLFFFKIVKIFIILWGFKLTYFLLECTIMHCIFGNKYIKLWNHNWIHSLIWMKFKLIYFFYLFFLKDNQKKNLISIFLYNRCIINKNHYFAAASTFYSENNIEKTSSKLLTKWKFIPSFTSACNKSTSGILSLGKIISLIFYLFATITFYFMP